MNGMPAQPVDARLSAAVDRWLSGRNLRPLTLMRAALERLILDAACSPRSARAVAMVPRHPFLPELAWRQAHAPTVAYPGLPAPLTVARLFDAAGARPGELVLILDQPLGWFSLVGGAFAALSDARAVTVGSPPVDSGLVRGLLHEFRVEVADEPPVRPDVVIAIHTSPQAVLPAMPLGGRAVWLRRAAGGARLHRLERRPDGWRVCDLGPSEPAGARGEGEESDVA